MPRPHIQEYLQKYVAKYKETGIEAEALILFGSQARGDAVLSSDIDIAVVMNVPLTSKERGMLRGIGDEVDHRIETNLFFTNRAALDAAHDIFDTNKYIREEGVVLWPV